MGKEYSPEYINSAFLTKMEDQSQIKEAQVAYGTYIRDKLRETQFCRKILNSKTVSNTDFGVQRSTQHDGLVFMDEVEPESGAQALTWTTMPDTTYIKQKRYEIPFIQVSSDEFEVTEQELLASKTPVHKVIEKNSVKDIGTIEDWYFLTLCETAVAATGQVIKGTAVNAGAASGDVEQDDIIGLMNQLSEEERPAKTLLINQTDFNKLLKWAGEEVGDEVRTKIVYGKWVPNSLYNLDILVTVKTSLLTQGNVWIFAPSEFLGRFLSLGSTKFYLKKERDLISYSTWEFIGMSIANIYSLAKLEIYSGASQSLPSQESLFTSRINTPPTVYPVMVSV